MNKKIIILGLSALIIIVSCKFLKKNDQPSADSEVSNVVASQVVGNAPSSPTSP